MFSSLEQMRISSLQPEAGHSFEKEQREPSIMLPDLRSCYQAAMARHGHEHKQRNKPRSDPETNQHRQLIPK